MFLQKIGIHLENYVMDHMELLVFFYFVRCVVF